MLHSPSKVHTNKKYTRYVSWQGIKFSTGGVRARTASTPRLSAEDIQNRLQNDQFRLSNGNWAEQSKAFTPPKRITRVVQAADQNGRDQHYRSDSVAVSTVGFEEVYEYRASDFPEPDEEVAPPYELLQRRLSFTHTGSHTEATITGQHEDSSPSTRVHKANTLF